MSHTTLAWDAAGKPASGHTQGKVTGPCTTCGDITDVGVALSQIETSTTSGHADLFRFGTRHVCPACAWMFNAGKGRPGNFLVAGDRIEYTVISLDSVVEDKRPWLTVLRGLAALPPDTPVTGVMTTDVKPRLWHRARLASVGAFGLYVHCPDYDASDWRTFDLQDCLSAIDMMVPILTAGFAKASVWYGLMRDHARVAKDPAKAFSQEGQLASLRGQPFFLPALIASGVAKSTKEPISGTATTKRTRGAA